MAINLKLPKIATVCALGFAAACGNNDAYAANNGMKFINALSIRGQAVPLPVCKARDGTPVRYVTFARDPEGSPFAYKVAAGDREAARELRADGLPHRAGAYVVINKALLSMVPPETRAHILAHECAHQRLGHTAHAPGNFRQLARAEAEADCEAVKIMRREFNMTNEAILRGLRAFKSPLLSGGEDTEHGSGTSRFHRGVACMIK